MATMTVSLPDLLQEWIEVQVRQGSYASASDYMHELVCRDRAEREQDRTPQDLRRKLDLSRESGTSGRTVEDIFAEASRIARGRE